MGKRISSRVCASFTLIFVGLCSSVKAEPPGLVNIRNLSRNIQVEMLYASSENFTGRKVPGYASNTCYLQRDVAEALSRVQELLEKDNRSLVVNDCYRPQKATDFFISWANDPSAGMGLQDLFFPLYSDKRELFSQHYISSRSVHTQGRAIDLSMGDLSPAGTFEVWDMGTRVDFLDPASRTSASGKVGSVYINSRHSENRRSFASYMRKAGFSNYSKEWWHWELR